MSSRPLFVSDFDGVIVDGICEYWWSAREACLKLLNNSKKTYSLPREVPDAFRQLRPWVNEGWEMVLLAAELIRPNSHLLQTGPIDFSEDYETRCKESLKAWNWTTSQLQQALNEVRSSAIKKNRISWLKKHKTFPGVVERLKQLNSEGLELVILTTKSREFTNALLDSFQLKPNYVYGHESGSKPEVLLELSRQSTIKCFIEDRRKTLETVLSTPGLESLPCYLVSWGYLKPKDQKHLPKAIQLLKPETLLTPLASWH